MGQITRRGMLLGSIVVTVSASGLVLSAREAEAFNLGGILAGVGHALGGAVVHAVNAVAQGVGHILQVAPQLIVDAANAAAQVVDAAAPLAGQLVGLEQHITQMAAGQLFQQLPIFCNPNANLNPVTMIPGISSQAMQLGGIAQQAVMQNPTSYIQGNMQDIINHLINYLLQGQPLQFSVPGAVTTPTGTTPTFMPAGVPFIGNQGQSGIFPALLGLNALDLAAGGKGLLSLFSLA